MSGAAAFRHALKVARRAMAPTELENVRSAVRAVARAHRGDDVLPARVCATLRTTYDSLGQDGRLGFLSILARDMGVDDAAVQRCSSTLDLARSRTADSSTPLLQAQIALREALVPPYERVLQMIQQQSDGARFLLSLRSDLLSALEGKQTAAAAAPSLVAAANAAGEAPAPAPSSGRVEPAGSEEDEVAHWRALDASLRRILSGCFEPSRLRLVCANWERSPAALLERIINYERVHPYLGWEDIKRRLRANRMIFAFLHPSMEEEPLVFVHVALAPRIPSALAQVLPPLQQSAAQGNASSGGRAGGARGGGWRDGER